MNIQKISKNFMIANSLMYQNKIIKEFVNNYFSINHSCKFNLFEIYIFNPNAYQQISSMKLKNIQSDFRIKLKYGEMFIGYRLLKNKFYPFFIKFDFDEDDKKYFISGYSTFLKNDSYFKNYINVGKILDYPICLSNDNNIIANIQIILNQSSQNKIKNLSFEI